jgi:hypothetical protein
MYRCSSTRSRLGMTSAFVLLLGLLGPATPAHAATLIVTTTADDSGIPSSNCTTGSGACTLRGALAAAQNGDTIEFTVGGTIAVTSTLIIGTNVAVLGPGAPVLAVDGQHAVTVFQVTSGVHATLAGLTIQNA